MDRFDQYAADELYFEEVWFNTHYPPLFGELMSQGYSREEAQELAIEELVEKWRAEVWI